MTREEAIARARDCGLNASEAEAFVDKAEEIKRLVLECRLSPALGVRLVLALVDATSQYRGLSRDEVRIAAGIDEAHAPQEDDRQLQERGRN